MSTFVLQYPDAPNLFTNVRRPYRPDVWTEFSRTWLISIIGIALVVTGTVTLIFNEVSKVQMGKSLCQIVNNLSLFLLFSMKNLVKLVPDEKIAIKLLIQRQFHDFYLSLISITLEKSCDYRTST